MSRSSALTARARRYLADAAHAFDHAPVEVTLSVVLAGTFSYAVASAGDAFQEWFELAVVVLLTGATAFTATLLHALGTWRMPTRWIVTVGGALAATLYGLFALDLALAADAWRAAALVAAAALIVLAAPALARSGSGAAGGSATDRFRRVTGRLLLRTIAVLLYAAALYAGLALALGAVNTLFELRLDGRIYAHTLGWVFFVLVTWVIVGGLADYVRADGDAGPVAAAVHRISAFLVTPLLAIYYLILYAYAVRIAITGELPKNLVSPLVIAAGVIAGVALVLFDRAAADPAMRGTAADGLDGAASAETGGSASLRALRIAAPLFVPLCVLGIWALGIRLGQYGWTEFRGLRLMLLITLGVLALAGAVRGRRRGSLPVHVLPLTLAVMIILSVTGPWSLIAASRRSQQARLADAMRTAGIEWNATVVRDTLIPNEPHREITETARYLMSHFGPDALPPVLARHAVGSERYADVVYAAGLRPARPDVAMPSGAYGQLENGALLDETGDGALYFIRMNLAVMRPLPGGRARGPAAGTGVAVGAGAPGGPARPDTSQSLRMRIPVGGLNLIADLTPISRTLFSGPAGARGASHDFPRIPLVDEGGRTRGSLYVLEIGIGDGEVHQLTAIARLTGT